MRVLHAYNTHRGMGGSDRTTAATIEVLRARGVEVEEFVRDSRTLPANLGGKITAFVGGLHGGEAVHAFEAVLRSRRPDVVHVHELYPLISPWILPCCTRAGVPVVMTCNDFRLSCPVATHFIRGETCYKCLGGREYWCVVRNCRDNVAESVAYAMRNASAHSFHLFDHVHRFVVISDFMRGFMVERIGLEASRVVVNYCAIGLPAEPVADPSQGTYVGFAGRFVPEKGVEVMVEACRSLGLPMRFAGDAPQHPAIRATDNATFVMTKTPQDLAAFYRGARVIVVPSTWTEAFGIVAAEALSHGIPVVASRLGGLTTTVADGEAGLLAEPGNAADFAEKIRRIWDDPQLARRLGRGARAYVERQFAHPVHFERLMAVYEDAIASPARTRR
jgi:glycosyltransferase involved in cell wall biosynthesis